MRYCMHCFPVNENRERISRREKYSICIVNLGILILLYYFLLVKINSNLRNIFNVKLIEL